MNNSPDIQASNSPPLVHEGQWNKVAIGFMAILFLSLTIANLVVAPSRFYDYETYLLYLDTIYHFRQPDWFVFEGLTKSYLLSLRAIFGTTTAAIVAAHYLLLAIFIAGFATIFRRTPWEAVVIAAALFAPQLGLITIRATPAYIVCTLGALRAVQGRPWAFRLVFLGTAFHVSAYLALIPVLAIKLISRTRLADFNLRPAAVVGAAGILGAIALLFAQGVFDFLIDLFKQIPYLSKYTAYAVGLADPNAVVERVIREPTSTNHYVFLGGVSALFFGLILFERERTLLKLFAAVSYILYLGIFLAFSPVPAFRFAPFFALPVLASVRIPQRFAFLRGIASGPLLLAGTAVFAVQLALVID